MPLPLRDCSRLLITLKRVPPCPCSKQALSVSDDARRLSRRRVFSESLPSGTRSGSSLPQPSLQAGSSPQAPQAQKPPPYWRALHSPPSALTQRGPARLTAGAGTVRRHRHEGSARRPGWWRAGSYVPSPTTPSFSVPCRRGHHSHRQAWRVRRAERVAPPCPSARAG